jgi:hypothetical protein
MGMGSWMSRITTYGRLTSARRLRRPNRRRCRYWRLADWRCFAGGNRETRSQRAGSVSRRSVWTTEQTGAIRGERSERCVSLERNRRPPCQTAPLWASRSRNLDSSYRHVTTQIRHPRGQSAGAYARVLAICPFLRWFAPSLTLPARCNAMVCSVVHTDLRLTLPARCHV